MSLLKTKADDVICKCKSSLDFDTLELILNEEMSKNNPSTVSLFISRFSPFMDMTLRAFISHEIALLTF